VVPSVPIVTSNASDFYSGDKAEHTVITSAFLDVKAVCGASFQNCVNEYLARQQTLIGNRLSGF
jgi:hypothetical protein